MSEGLGLCLDRVRQRAPLVHNITNYVTANDVANLLLACGARPVMADDPRETAEIASHAAALHLNLGTFSAQRYEAMLAAGQAAGAAGRPIVLDPVGAGGSTLRRQSALALLQTFPVTVIRGNYSELRALAEDMTTTGGVDGARSDEADPLHPEKAAEHLKAMARSMETILAATGAVDLVTDGERCFIIRNGRGEMSRITGTGCQLSALTAAFLAANPDAPLEAAAAAVCAMGLAGERGWQRMGPLDGNIAYRGYLIDAVYHLSGEELEKGANYEVQ